jgi:hypothetical protein
MTEEVNNQAAPEVQPETAAEAQPGAELNISDLVAVKSIIEVASQRGAFKAAELEAVGKTFNKLNTFIESVSKKEA